MDNHYASIEDRHSKIIDNVQDIQQAINFVSEVCCCQYSIYSERSKDV